MQMFRPGGVLEASKLAGQAKDKFSKVQELYKVLMKTRLCWTNVALLDQCGDSHISGVGHTVTSWELLEVLPAMGLHHLLDLLPCLSHHLSGN